MSIKITLPQQTNIISITDDCATLEEISKSGFYIYKFKYLIDPTHWSFAKNGTKPTNLLLSIVRNKSDASKISLFNDKTDNFANNILTNVSKQKDLTKHLEDQNIIWTYRSDFTKNIPNNMVKNIQQHNALSSNEKLVLTRKTETKTMLVSDIKNSKQVLPKLQVNKVVSNNQLPVSIGERKIKHIKNEFLYKFGIDPAAMFGLRTNSIISATTSLNGFIISNKPASKLDSKTKIISKNKNISNLVNNTEKLSLTNKNGESKLATNGHLNKIKNISAVTKQNVHDVLKSSGLLNEKDLTSTDDMSDGNSIPVAVVVENNLITIEELVHIPIGILGIQDFNLTFELRTPLGTLVQKLESHVKHNQKVLDNEIPTQAPDLMISSIKPGKFFIQLTQNDEDATSIQLYRRVVSLDEPIKDASYSLIKTVPIEKGQHPILVEDNISSLNPIIYRAISASSAGVLGGEFASLAIKQQQNKTVSKIPFLRHPSFISLTHRISKNQIELILSNIPSEPVAVQIIKRNVTLHDKSFAPVTNVILLSNGNENSLSIFDNRIKDSNIYEYKVKLIHNNGSEIISPNNLLVEYLKIETNIINIKLTPPSIISTNDAIDTQFNIEKEIISTDKDNIKSLLSEQGLLEEYQSDVILNKEQLQDLFFIRVVRTNITTGEKEDFGIINSTIFQDSKFGKVKNVKELEGGMKYRYTIYAHARAPNTLLENIDSTVVTRGITSTYKASKWRNPVVLKQGNIVTDQTLLRNHSKTQFTLGNIVDIQYLDLDLSNSKASIVNGKSSNINSKTNLINWTTNGNINNIDHFIITMTMSGNKTVVGKCHNITKSSNFQFVDIMNNHESGELVYGIIPIYYDYSSGNEYSTNAILI